MSDQLNIRFFCLSVLIISALLLPACLSLEDLPEVIRPVLEPESEATASSQIPTPPTLSETIETTPSLNAYFSVPHGVALRYPAAWEVDESRYLTLASDPDLFDALNNEDFELSQIDGVVVSIVPAGEDLLSAANPANALTVLVEGETDAEIVGRAQPLSLGGQDGATMTGLYRSDPQSEDEGDDLTALFALIRSRDGGVVVTALTTRFQEDRITLESLIESVIVSESAQNRNVSPFPLLSNSVEIEEEPTPAGPVVYRPADRSFEVTHPSDWLVADEDEGAILVASNRELLLDNFFDSGSVVWIFPQALAPSEVESPNAVLLLEKFIANFGIYDSLDLISPPEETLIGEFTAATAQYDAVFTGYPVLVDYYAVTAEGKVIFFVILIASDSISTDRPITEAIVQSIAIR